MAAGSNLRVKYLTRIILLSSFAAMQIPAQQIDRVFAAIDAATDEMVDFTAEMIRIPTVNPPGDAYEECARFIGQRLDDCGFTVEYLTA